MALDLFAFASWIRRASGKCSASPMLEARLVLHEFPERL